MEWAGHVGQFTGSDWLVWLFIRFAIGDSDLWNLDQEKRRTVAKGTVKQK